MKLPYRIVGNSDCGLAYTDFQEKFNSPTLIIHRDKFEVLESLIINGISDRSVLGLLNDLELRLLDLKGMHVDFHEIDLRLPEIHQYLTGELPDENRARLYSNMNIQPIDTSGSEESMRIWLCRG